MNYSKAYAQFEIDMAKRGYTTTPLTRQQFLFLHRDCELERVYVDGVAMDVACGVDMRYAVLVAIEHYRKDQGLAV